MLGREASGGGGGPEAAGGGIERAGGAFVGVSKLDFGVDTLAGCTSVHLVSSIVNSYEMLDRARVCLRRKE